MKVQHLIDVLARDEFACRPLMAWLCQQDVERDAGEWWATCSEGSKMVGVLFYLTDAPILHEREARLLCCDVTELAMARANDMLRERAPDDADVAQRLIAVTRANPCGEKGWAARRPVWRLLGYYMIDAEIDGLEAHALNAVSLCAGWAPRLDEVTTRVRLELGEEAEPDIARVIRRHVPWEAIEEHLQMLGAA